MDAVALLLAEEHAFGLYQRKAGPADDDPLRQIEHADGFAPAPKRCKAVGSGKIEALVVGKKLLQAGKRIYGVVGLTVGVRRVEFRGCR